MSQIILLDSGPLGYIKALDGDVILAAQAEMMRARGLDVLIATGNVKHLDRLTQAEEWRKIG